MDFLFRFRFLSPSPIPALGEPQVHFHWRRWSQKRDLTFWTGFQGFVFWVLLFTHYYWLAGLECSFQTLAPLPLAFPCTLITSSGTAHFDLNFLALFSFCCWLSSPLPCAPLSRIHGLRTERRRRGLAASFIHVSRYQQDGMRGWRFFICSFCFCQATSGGREGTGRYYGWDEMGGMNWLVCAW
ncbi:hypothetical protein IWZ01DRAFT_65533 [Phyllosticta capitalensis]|uniref:Uncharacterized protein n=1 Tax=Phyllosticta capitalensis TaxID=121624 RepID=A0ABR1YET7_9PEZI